MRAAQQAALTLLLDAGFAPDGATRTATVRVPTRDAPVLGQSGGVLATFGGRPRLAHGVLRATVGPRTVALYRQEAPGLAGVRGIATVPTHDLDALRSVVQQTLAGSPAPSFPSA